MIYLYIAWRLADVLITLVAPFVIPYLGFFPYRGALLQYHLPDFLTNLASFDGVHYTLIADGGYAQHEQAFFPFYPLLIRALTLITQNRLVSGLLIANIAFAAGLVLIKKYAAMIGDGKTAPLWSVIFILLFPTSFFFGAVYTEGLFFLLFVSSLYFLRKKNYWLAGTCAALASATRLMGIFLVIPFLFHFINEGALRNWRHGIKKINLPFVLTPLVGFSIYCIYLWKTVGDPLYFFNSQPSFGANRSTHLILLPQVYFRYIKIFFTAQWNFQYFTSLVEFIFFTFVFTVLVLDLLKIVKPGRQWNIKVQNYDRLALSLFSVVNLLLPTLTGTFSSVPRYALLSVSLFLFLGEIKNVKIKYLVAAVFLILHAVLLGFFIQGYFVG